MAAFRRRARWNGARRGLCHRDGRPRLGNRSIHLQSLQARSQAKRKKWFETFLKLMPARIEKKCSRCGAHFECRQEAGCWCTGVHLDPVTLVELRARFSDCLCEPCLGGYAASEKGSEA